MTEIRKWSIIALAASAVLFGCGKQPEEMGNQVKESAGKAAETVKEKTKEAGAAFSLTPLIKTALVANPYLHEDGNLIDVDTTTTEVRLKGHVKSAKYRRIAVDLTKKVMKDNNCALPLKDELTINPS